MSQPTSIAAPPALSSALACVDQALLRLAGRIVPPADRSDWQRSWQAELWHKRNQAVQRFERRPRSTEVRGAHSRRSIVDRIATRLRTVWPTADLAPGLLRDALWLRSESCQRVLRGTALLCLAGLLGLCLLATLISLALHGGSHPLANRLADLLPRVTLAASLVLFVTFSVAPRRPTHQTFPVETAVWLQRQLFLAAKLTLLLVLTFLLSTDLTAPFSTPPPLTADFLQILLFVLLAIVALRWALADQEQRCKHCLRSLSAPARVGRPSRNLLEWNGTELSCNRGHGLLTIPELETSWCQSSQWIPHHPFQNETAIT